MNESKKVLLRRAEIIQNEKRLQFSNGIILVLFSLGELAFSAIWTIIIAFYNPSVCPFAQGRQIWNGGSDMEQAKMYNEMADVLKPGTEAVAWNRKYFEEKEKAVH